MARLALLLAASLGAATLCRATDTSSLSLDTMLHLSDDELKDLWLHPEPGQPPIPSQATPNEWDSCKGRPFVNLLTDKSDSIKGPVSNQDYGNQRLWGAAWYGKTFRTSRETGLTYLWNLLFDDSHVALQANTFIFPNGFLNDGPPSIGMNYSMAEIVPARSFFGEMRYLGNNLYLGKQYIVNPEFTLAHTGQHVKDATPGPFPIFITYFGLECGHAAPEGGYKQILPSKISSDILNYELHFWPKGYKLPEPV